MHDDLVERQLRTAFREEASQLAFTITAAELERRAILRGRTAPRRLTILLAAALAVGALGGAGLLAGLAEQPSPSPTAPAVVDASGPPPSPAGRRQLPALDDLVATDPASVLVAQAHGPDDRPYELGFEWPFPTGLTVDLGTVHGGGDYRVSMACLGASAHASMTLDIRTPGDRATAGPTGPEIRCDGTLVEHQARTQRSATVSLYLEEPASWRIVVRSSQGILQSPLPTEDPVLPPAAPDREELLRRDGEVIQGGDPWGDGLRLLIQEVGSVGARWAYEPLLWCESGVVRLVYGDHVDGVLVPVTETQVACNGALHDLYMGIPSPYGSPIYVAAALDTRWSLRVAAEAPPIELPGLQPGWQLSTGFGPDLTFVETEHGMTGLGVEGGGPVRVALACVSDQPVGEPIEVTVDIGAVAGAREEKFEAACSRDGGTTSRSFETEASYVDVTYTAPAGSWTALSILVPDPPPAAP